MPQSPTTAPRGLWITTAFFALAGLLEIGIGLWEIPTPRPFWPMWEALGRGVLYFLLALGLWRRSALCRTVAMVYCLAVVAMYLVVLAMALGHAPVRFPPSVVLQSLYQVPSCVLLLPYLRSREASVLFGRALLE